MSSSLVRGKRRPLRGASKVVSGPADPLEEQPQGARRAHLAHQVYRADVDAQLQRGRRHAHLDVAVLQSLLGLVASLLGEAAVVGDDRLFAQALGHLMGDALHQPAGVDEDQRRPVAPDQLGDAVQGGVPLLVGGDGAQLSSWELQRQVDLPGVARIDDETAPPARLSAFTHQEPGHLLDGALGGREPDSRDLRLR